MNLFPPGLQLHVKDLLCSVVCISRDVGSICVDLGVLKGPDIANFCL